MFNGEDQIFYGDDIDQQLDETSIHNKQQQKTPIKSIQTTNEAIIQTPKNKKSRIQTSKIHQKQIRKDKKSREQKSHRWTIQGHKKYINFFLRVQRQRPYLNLSWREWKVNNIYPEAAKSIGISKIQVKSYDQRMKEKNGHIYSLQSFIYQEAKKLSHEDKTIQDNLTLLNQMLQTKSKHMQIISQRLQMLENNNPVIQKLLRRNND